uniref:Uncharacterized protein n=1 Tax=Populus trichocarpa TaxID=3694 RepID=A9PFT2_POPTR|nr:unknown [Populus trichocarpa]
MRGSAGGLGGRQRWVLCFVSLLKMYWRIKVEVSTRRKVMK